MKNFIKSMNFFANELIKAWEYGVEIEKEVPKKK
jgi:hypothetical protein